MSAGIKTKLIQMKSSLAKVSTKVSSAIRMLDQLSPRKIYAHSFGIFDAKTANFNCDLRGL